jgi:hypothetical protein
MASIVNSKLYYAMLQIAKSENIGSRLQFAARLLVAEHGLLKYIV